MRQIVLLYAINSIIRQMALFSLPPASPQSDLNLMMFLKGNAPEDTSIQLSRTLAPEWYTQSGVQLTWPHSGTDWAYMLPEITECYIRLAFEIATRETLLIVAPDVNEVKSLLEERLPHRAASHIVYFECPTNDTWARDHAFLTVVSGNGPELLDFHFNGWGGRFEAELDNALNARLAGLLKGKYVDCLDFVLEGGSVETDGRGTLLTTSQCLLNPNRNPQLDQAHIEALLCERLGVSRILWLHHGHLAGDDTDSHVDTLARLCPNQTIIYVQCTDKKDEHYESLKAMEQELEAMETADGHPYRLMPLPWPGKICDEQGERLPATYANYLVMNTTILYPTYARPETDEAAARVLRQAFPDHDVVGIDCRALIKQHGSLHCATMQYPKGVLPDLCVQSRE